MGVSVILPTFHLSVFLIPVTYRFNINIPLNLARHKLFLTNKFNWHKREFSNCDPIFAVGFFQFVVGNPSYSARKKLKFSFTVTSTM